ncbi:MAG TPA: serine/threonine-protein kinase [Kofleriaceae bacterium]|nr:serine/threonine-protein kinase [Kofleriaceae bacterium]
MLGTIIGGHRIIRALGQGGMGAVYLAEHTLLGRRAAVKVLLPAFSQNPEMVTRFFNEARAATAIADPGIVQIYDFGYHTDGSAFIVMELLEGEPLDKRLERLGRLPVVEALRIGRQIATTLAAAHARGIVHRDLKPENVFLVRDNEVASGERVRLLDFGIAKLTGDERATSKTQTGAIMGTPLYMSPEQCRGAGEVDHRSDIYALGCMLYHLLVGRPPFVGEGLGEILAMQLYETATPPSVVLPFLGGALDGLVMRCLAKSPAERFADMNEVALEIARHLASPSVLTPPAGVDIAALSNRWQVQTVMSRTPTTLGGAAGSAPVLPPPPPRSRRQRLAIVGVLALGILAGAGFAWRVTRAPASNVEAAPLPETATPLAPAIDAGTVEEVLAPAIDAALVTAPIDASISAPVDGSVDASVDARERDRSSSHHPTRVRRASENPRSVTPAPDQMGGTEDPCRMDEQGNVIDRHRCKE